MILLDTHIWLWWVGADSRLEPKLVEKLKDAEHDGLAVSAVSCWEVAYKAALGKLELEQPIESWMDGALATPNVSVEPVSARIAVEAALLPGEFHRDPADRLIVATARVLDVPLLSLDGKIASYAHVKHA